MRSSLSDFQNGAGKEVEEKDESWFYTQLSRNCKEVVEHGSNFQIICPFHVDSNPSCNVDRTSGQYHCFSCKAGGPWNRLAATIGADELGFIDGDESESMELVKNKLSRALSKAGVKRIKTKEDVGKPLVDAWRAHDDLRGLSGKMLRKLGCVRVTDLVHNVLRIGLPIRNMKGQLHGYTCRAIDPEDAEPKYIPLSADRQNYREKEIPVRDAIFHLDLALRKKWRAVILVEGPFDALFLLRMGIPAMAILGTSSWTPQKVSMLATMNLDRVVVLMDNDASGKKAQKAIIASLKPYVPVRGVNFPKGIKDPEDLSEAQFEWLKSKLFD